MAITVSLPYHYWNINAGLIHFIVCKTGYTEQPPSLQRLCDVPELLLLLYAFICDVLWIGLVKPYSYLGFISVEPCTLTHTAIITAQRPLTVDPTFEMPDSLP